MRKLIMKYKFILFFVVGCIVVSELYFLFTNYGKVHLYDVLITISVAYYINELYLKEDNEEIN